MTDREALARSPTHELALDCVAAGIDAARPERAVADACDLDGDTLVVRGDRYDLSEYDRVLVLGAGKATAGLVDALRDLLGDRIDGGCVAVPEPADCAPVEVVVAGHPTPDTGSREAADRILDLAAAADDRTLVLAPISGGGSALLAAPAEGLDFEALRQVTDALVESGASIDEINAVRKHCSAVKGGRLARALEPAAVVGLLVSDVVGDDPSVVASGPLAPDPTTYAEALDVLDRYGIDAPAVRDHLAAGAAGEHEETPKSGDPAFDRVTTHVVASGRTAVDAAAALARERGYTPLVLSTRIRGEAREAARTQVAVAEEALASGDPVTPPAVVLSGGETTVTVTGDGDGGPNLEFALAAALELPDDAVLASVDTDGFDGSTDVAGALVDATTVDDATAARDALGRNDALGYLRDRDATVETGSTGTNVNDLRVLVVGYAG
jgi:hydroxypyruvate reductase